MIGFPETPSLLELCSRLQNVIGFIIFLEVSPNLLEFTPAAPLQTPWQRSCGCHEEWRGFPVGQDPLCPRGAVCCFLVFLCNCSVGAGYGVLLCCVSVCILCHYNVCWFFWWSSLLVKHCLWSPFLIDPIYLLSTLQATGRTMDSYVHEHQDKSRNALNRALEASFQAWIEELRADQAQFTSEKVLTLF